MLTFRLILESFRFAWGALRGNILRTVLSLLGVTVGIFAIIAVFTFVDSLEKNIKDSLNFLGSGVIYVDKWPFPGGEEFKWWDYFRRPNPSYNEYKFLQAKLKNRSSIAIYSDRGNQVIRRGTFSIGQISLIGGSQGFNELQELNIEQGRYFTSDEIENGRGVAVLGYEVAAALFPNNQNPIGETIKIKDQNFRVAGVIKREGESFFGRTTNDYNVIVPYQSFRRMYQTGSGRWNELEST
ncbi:MAG: ABC transporter, partial [Cytophaga sp.]|nr:ABC transporter [Cytophaga sp.]